MCHHLRCRFQFTCAGNFPSKESLHLNTEVFVNYMVIANILDEEEKDYFFLIQERSHSICEKTQIKRDFLYMDIHLAL